MLSRVRVALVGGWIDDKFLYDLLHEYLPVLLVLLVWISDSMDMDRNKGDNEELVGPLLGFRQGLQPEKAQDNRRRLSYQFFPSWEKELLSPLSPPLKKEEREKEIKCLGSFSLARKGIIYNYLSIWNGL